MKIPFLVPSLVFAALLSAAHTHVIRVQPSGDDLTGIYACEGTLPEGAKYEGVVEIVRVDGTYQVLWALPPHEHYLGIGLNDGTSLSVSVFSGEPAVAVYHIERKSDEIRLTGHWTSVGADGRVFSETLTKIGPSSGSPHFKVVPRREAQAPGSKSL